MVAAVGTALRCKPANRPPIALNLPCMLYFGRYWHASIQAFSELADELVLKAARQVLRTLLLCSV
jgi:hypothetical protein